jgi:hypothetical protein
VKIPGAALAVTLRTLASPCKTVWIDAMSNRNLLILVLVIVAGVTVILMMQNKHEEDNTLSGVINETTEEIKDEIDDHTTN